jgi:hypothetical protein
MVQQVSAGLSLHGVGSFHCCIKKLYSIEMYTEKAGTVRACLRKGKYLSIYVHLNKCAGGRSAVHGHRAREKEIPYAPTQKAS